MEKTTRVHEEWGWGGFASTGLGRLKTGPRDESYLNRGLRGACVSLFKETDFPASNSLVFFPGLFLYFPAMALRTKCNI